MEKKTTALLLRLVDKGESDRVAFLLTADEGVIAATFRGVRKAKARLRYAARPFSLCEYELGGRENAYIVTGATVIEDLYGLCTSPETFACASIVTEAAEKSSAALDDGTAFVVALKTLKALLFGEASCGLVVAKYLQKITSMSGLTTIPSKKTEYPATPSGVLDRIAYLRLDELGSLDIDGNLVYRAVKLMASRFSSAFGCELKSLGFYSSMFAADGRIRKI